MLDLVLASNVAGAVELMVCSSIGRIVLGK